MKTAYEFKFITKILTGSLERTCSFSADFSNRAESAVFP